MTKSPTQPTPARKPGDPATAGPIYDQVAAVLERIRPVIQDDGGDIELVGVTPEGVVQVRLHGACVGCPSSTMTLQHGVQRMVREKVPAVTAVQQID